MKKTILIAPNSYKESADSVEAAGLFEKYLSGEGYNIIMAPISDGGDGFLKVCKYHFNLGEYSFMISSPVSMPVKVNAGYNMETQTAYIESADAVGLKVIPPDKRNPMVLSSAGLGELLVRLKQTLAVKKVVIGIGGTGVNDLGLGMLSAIGLKLLDNHNKVLEPVPANFAKVKDFTWEPDFSIPVELVVDVANPLTGENGTTYVYGPQKGLKKEELHILDSEFTRLINIFKQKGFPGRDKILSGAGGGVAAGMQIFLDAEIRNSSSFILGDLNIKDHITNADYIISGEGSFDAQSGSGKGTFIILENSRKKPFFLVCGIIKNDIELNPGVISIELQKYFTNLETSIQRIDIGIEKASKEILKILSTDNI